MTSTNSSVLQVEIWSDIACPWCFIGKTRFAAALAEFDRRDRVEVTWRSYQLSPETPVGSGERELDALVRMKGLPAEQVAVMFERVAGVAAADGLTIDFDTVIAANTFDAHRLVHIASAQGLGDEVLSSLFVAHFTQGRVVDDISVLVELAERAGVKGASDALARGEGADEVRSDLALAREVQVSGVPFFVADRRMVVSGAQQVEVFAQLLDRGFVELDGDRR
ncbi:DsbA family oxidoreductase [Rhodococcoides yunnanense]|uniref:DsbA family oxidoreductase n=1 Tax=Rhodococcoides yunnanense TaxID=278209 RepID=UPI000933FCC0|nr:DsbA family oxidoreductase [Rhodococcus yunnanensis]